MYDRIGKYDYDVLPTVPWVPRKKVLLFFGAATLVSVAVQDVLSLPISLVFGAIFGGVGFYLWNGKQVFLEKDLQLVLWTLATALPTWFITYDLGGVQLKQFATQVIVAASIGWWLQARVLYRLLRGVRVARKRQYQEYLDTIQTYAKERGFMLYPEVLRQRGLEERLKNLTYVDKSKCWNAAMRSSWPVYKNWLLLNALALLPYFIHAIEAPVALIANQAIAMIAMAYVVTHTHARGRIWLSEKHLDVIPLLLKNALKIPEELLSSEDNIVRGVKGLSGYQAVADLAENYHPSRGGNATRFYMTREELTGVARGGRTTLLFRSHCFIKKY